MEFMGLNAVEIDGNISLRSLHFSIGAEPGKRPGKFLTSGRRYTYRGRIFSYPDVGMCVPPDVALDYLCWAMPGVEGDALREAIESERKSVSDSSDKMKDAVVHAFSHGRVDDLVKLVDAVDSAINDYWSAGQAARKGGE